MTVPERNKKVKYRIPYGCLCYLEFVVPGLCKSRESTEDLLFLLQIDLLSSSLFIVLYAANFRLSLQKLEYGIGVILKREF